ncbi:glutamate racemase [Reinekea sp.]|jgi:glutamate racemase|uniref:glutamate racemase n=1 Tax=Reinekea sp. TaxID=1970455 RepID=UPI002A817333|nr:glutamate racemase [Reinekea sp.]
MIGVFDSGIGGLTVLSHIRAQLPDTPIVYLADQAYAPYGDLTHDRVIERSRLISQWLLAQGCTLVVVACNTATAVAIEALRTGFAIPIVGVEPGIKPAALQSLSQRIGILATENTVASSRYLLLLERFLPEVEVLSQGCAGLADAIEQQSDDLDQRLRRYCQPLIDQGVDQIVLGCTHYPLVKDRIALLVGPQVAIVDTSGAIALEVKRRYQPPLTGPVVGAPIRLYTTGSAVRFDSLMRSYPMLAWLQDLAIAELTLRS